jgi:predicted RNase H-like HicB family nuclease
VTVPSILGCTTTGRSIEDAIKKAREAIELHLRYLAEEGLPIPEPRRPVEIRIVPADREGRVREEPSP